MQLHSDKTNPIFQNVKNILNVHFIQFSQFYFGGRHADHFGFNCPSFEMFVSDLNTMEVNGLDQRECVAISLNNSQNRLSK